MFGKSVYDEIGGYEPTAPCGFVPWRHGLKKVIQCPSGRHALLHEFLSTYRKNG
jgi:hypothetical protein